jgi:glycosyltransferase 2 family protein
VNHKRVWLAVQAIVTTVLLVLLLRGLDLNAFRALFVRLPIGFYLLSLAVVLAGQVAYAWRWRLLLTAAGARVPFPKVVRQYFVGIFVNNFLPSTIGGDVAKVYYLGQEHGYRAVTASVAIDRLLGVGLLALLAAAALSVSPIAAPRLSAAQVGCSGIALLAIALLMVTSKGTGGLPAQVAWLGERAVSLAERLQRLRLDMAAPLARPAIVAQAAVVVIGYALAMTVVYMRFVALQNAAAPPFMAMFAVVTATAVLSNVPISLNGLGLREQLHASLLAPLGIAPELAVAISLLVYAHLVIASLIGLAFWYSVDAKVSSYAPDTR